MTVYSTTVCCIYAGQCMLCTILQLVCVCIILIDASVSCGSGLLIVFEEEGTAQFCGSITRSGEVISVAVEASVISLNGQHASEGKYTVAIYL